MHACMCACVCVCYDFLKQAAGCFNRMFDRKAEGATDWLNCRVTTIVFTSIYFIFYQSIQ